MEQTRIELLLSYSKALLYGIAECAKAPVRKGEEQCLVSSSRQITKKTQAKILTPNDTPSCRRRRSRIHDQKPKEGEKIVARTRCNIGVKSAL
jgi:hypothetical protein